MSPRRKHGPPAPSEGCKWYVSIDQTECGEPSVGTVKFTNRAGMSVMVPLCSLHKARHDEIAASIRTSRTKKVEAK